jgi:glycine C-acetyltransferase
VPKSNFYKSLLSEIERLDSAGISKRKEVVIEDFTKDPSPQALVAGKKLRIFNSNDYLGLRHNSELKLADHDAVEKYGTGPGAVRFISGSLSVYKQLEQKIAAFHGREDAMVVSSAFATNVAVLSCLLKGQSKDSLVVGNTLVVSDELNHRSIIDGIRAASINSAQKAIFQHMNGSDLDRVLAENQGNFDRVVVVTDGVFSMLGEYQDLQDLSQVISKYDDQYPQGVLLIVDDAHGVGCFGKTGRGVEEVCQTKADVLVGTLGKAFGTDGGYVVGDQVVIDYLRESAATYIYSNSISPGTAGAAVKAFEMMMGAEGEQILKKLGENITLCKTLLQQNDCQMAANSDHPIQPLLIGDPQKAKAVKMALFEKGFLVSNINYPVVPKGRDEIRIQISAAHTKEDIELFVNAVKNVMASL